jgi:hypothetical protein
MRFTLADLLPSKLVAAWGALRATKHRPPSDIAHWHETRQQVPPLAEIRSLLHSVGDDRPDGPAPSGKGVPDLASIKHGIAGDVQSRLAAGETAEAMKAAHRLAALDLNDGAAFRIYLGLVSLTSAAALAQARSRLGPQVVLHVSCRPRLERARASSISFEPAARAGVSQLIVVGSPAASAFDFDAAGNVLSVPAGDSYEHLPEKVVSAFFFLSLCGHVDAVLKVDDDHRLRAPAPLLDAFGRLGSRVPVQAGRRSNSDVVGLHSRVWHFGKCADPQRDARPYALLAPSRWIDGASGYFLNRAALRLMLWSHVYFGDYVRIGLYEDLIVSDLVERQGGRLVDLDMAALLQAVEEY